MRRRPRSHGATPRRPGSPTGSSTSSAPRSRRSRRFPGPFDLVFIDADKDGYVDYYEAALPKLAANGVILADNTFAATRDSPNREGIARFNEHVRTDERVESVLLTIRDGVTLIRRR